MIAQLKDGKRKRICWKAAKPYWAGLLPHQVDDVTSTDYVRWRNRAANTIRNDLTFIKTALNWAEAKGMIPKAPKIILPSMPPSRVSHLTKTQFRTFLEGCHAPHIRLFAQLAVLTGGRVSALLELTWDQVDLDRGLLNLNPSGRVQKANKQRAIVPLNDRAIGLVHEAAAARTCNHAIEWGGDRVLSVKTAMKAASRRAGEGYAPYVQAFGRCLDGRRQGANG